VADWIVVLPRVCAGFDPGSTERALLSTVSVEDYVQDALHLVELDRVQGVGHLDIGVAFPLDRDD
jgi:hypothetical protein